MIEKLVKTGNDYILYSKDKTVLGITSGTMEGRMLSLKNCQAIENGYDLNELAEKHYDVHIKQGHTKEDSLQRKIDFILGFQKALEILSDKKFSEEDVKFMFQLGFNLDNAISRNEYNTHIQSLQQNEWDVEIVMECPQCKEYGYISECRNVCNKKFIQPKLDADGCLILRRI